MPPTTTLSEKLKRKLEREPFPDELEAMRARKRAKDAGELSCRAKSVAAFGLQEDGGESADEDEWRRYWEERSRHWDGSNFEPDYEENAGVVRADAWKKVAKLLRSPPFRELAWKKQLRISTDEVDDGNGDSLRELGTSATLYSPLALPRAVELGLHFWQKPRYSSCEFSFSIDFRLIDFTGAKRPKFKALCSTRFVDCPDDGMEDDTWEDVESVTNNFSSAAVKHIRSWLLGGADDGHSIASYELMELLLSATGLWSHLVDSGNALDLRSMYELKAATGRLTAEDRAKHEPYDPTKARTDWGKMVLEKAKEKAEEAEEEIRENCELDEEGDYLSDDEEGQRWNKFWKEFDALEKEPSEVWALAKQGELPWAGERWARKRQSDGLWGW